ncbi:MAG: hypothetical protein ABUK11_06390 [Mariprofundaceae bacterium]
MKKMFLSAVAFAVVAVSAIAVAPTTSEAVPAFARQTGASCLSCHFQAIPRLSAFGRNFSLTGMRDMGEGSLLEDDVLSLPTQFNAGFLMKVLVRNATGLIGTESNTGIMFPDESALFVGGRYGEHVGGLTEISTNNGGGVAQAKLNYVVDTDFGHVNLAMVSGDVGLGVLFSDPSNTVRHTNRSSIKRAEALQNTAMMNSGVTGFALSTLVNDSIYLQGALFASASPGEITGEWGSLSGLSTYLRGAYIAEVGGLEAIIGAFYVNAKPSAFTGATVTTVAAQTTGLLESAVQYGLDLQVQGDVGDLSIGFYLPWVIKGEQVGNTGTDITGGQAMLTIGMGHAGVKLGYDFSSSETGTVSTDTNATYLGAWYSVAQNVELELAYVSTKVDGVANTSNVTTLVIEYVY